MRIFDRLRDWLLGSVLHEVANHKVATARAIEDATNHLSRQLQTPKAKRNAELQPLIDAIGRLNNTLNSCEGSALEPVLQILRAEPAMAFKKWLDESKDRDEKTRRQYKERESKLLDRWQEHSASQQARIDVLEKALQKMDERLDAIDA